MPYKYSETLFQVVMQCFSAGSLVALCMGLIHSIQHIFSIIPVSQQMSEVLPSVSSPSATHHSSLYLEPIVIVGINYINDIPFSLRMECKPNHSWSSFSWLVSNTALLLVMSQYTVVFNITNHHPTQRIVDYDSALGAYLGCPCAGSGEAMVRDWHRWAYPCKASSH